MIKCSRWCQTIRYMLLSNRWMRFGKVMEIVYYYVVYEGFIQNVQSITTLREL